MQNDSIKVSVIIPCYNCEAWIRKCIGSLERQTKKSFEIICVDDCSTDNTRYILEDIKKSVNIPFKILINDHNIGPGKSRNKAIENSLGKWIAFCDSDDWYEPVFIEKMLSKAESTSCDIVMCEYRKVFESEKKSIDVHYLYDVDENAGIERMIISSKASLCLLLIRKELFNTMRIPDLRNGEDIAFIPCIESYANNISLVKEPLYNYLMRKQSASNRVKSDKVYKSLRNAYIFTEKNINRRYTKALEFLGIRNVLYGVVLNALKVNTDFKTVRRIIFEFEKKYPRWNTNTYIDTLSKSKRLFLICVKMRLLILCKFFALIHSIVSI